MFREVGENLVWGKGGGVFYSILSAALRPVGIIYGTAAGIREKLYHSGVFREKAVKEPVISVGNITLGGSGKTPVVMELARQLAAEGCKPAILTRGYGGTDPSPARVVSPDDDSASVGDEALLMAKCLPDVNVVRAAERADGAELAQGALQPDIFLLDDGFGHLALKRDMDIVVIDAARGIGNGRVFPAGPLREPLTALARADVVMVRLDGPDE